RAPPVVPARAGINFAGHGCTALPACYKAAMQPAPSNPIFCAIDTDDLAEARALVARAGPHLGGIKVGKQFFTAQGPQGVAALTAEAGLPLFLDLKFHDIPNTVAGAVRAAVKSMAPFILNVHASGGPA